MKRKVSYIGTQGSLSLLMDVTDVTKGILNQRIYYSPQYPSFQQKILNQNHWKMKIKPMKESSSRVLGLVALAGLRLLISAFRKLYGTLKP